MPPSIGSRQPNVPAALPFGRILAMGAAVVVVALSLAGAYREWIGESPEFGRCMAEIAKITPGMSAASARVHVDRANQSMWPSNFVGCPPGDACMATCRRFRHGLLTEGMWHDPSPLGRFSDDLFHLHRGLFGKPDLYEHIIRFAAGAVSRVETNACSMEAGDVVVCEIAHASGVRGQPSSP